MENNHLNLYIYIIWWTSIDLIVGGHFDDRPSGRLLESCRIFIIHFKLF